MKKYIVGFLLGVLLTLPASVFAEDISSIGKRIAAEFTVLLNGEELPVKAVAFEGTSYAPVRAIGEALGLDVDFKDGVVILNTKDDEAMYEETTFEGLGAIIKDGETYFSWKDYNDKFAGQSFAIGYDSEKRQFFYVELEGSGSGEIKERFLEFNQDDPGVFLSYKGASHINIKYYKEPSDFEAAE